MSSETNKLIAIIRHGRTEMNDHLSETKWGSANFNDAELWDTRLTDIGIEQASILNRKILDSNNKYSDLQHADLIVSSPLTRAMHTAELAFQSTKFSPLPSQSEINVICPLFSLSLKSPLKLVLPLASERVYLSSDIGRSKCELIQDFPTWDFTYLNSEMPWWYQNSINFNPQHTIKGSNVNGYIEWRPDGYYAVAGEPIHIFRNRIQMLRKWLSERHEKMIVLVCHWGVAKALTGLELENCEVKFIEMRNILHEPCIDDSE